MIAADTNYTLTTTGSLPDGMAFDPVSGLMYGTPQTDGVFRFRVEASPSKGVPVARTYLLSVAKAGEVLPPHSSVEISTLPLEGGTTTGEGVYANGTDVAATATPADGFGFVNWTDNGAVVSSSPTYQFDLNIHRVLVAHFAPMPRLTIAAPQAGTLLVSWPTNFPGFVLQRNSNLDAANWVKVPSADISVKGADYQALIAPTALAGFFRLASP